MRQETLKAKLLKMWCQINASSLLMISIDMIYLPHDKQFQVNILTLIICIVMILRKPKKGSSEYLLLKQESEWCDLSKDPGIITYSGKDW